MNESMRFRVHSGKLWYGDREIIVPARLAEAREQVSRWNDDQLADVVNAMQGAPLEADQSSLLAFFKDEQSRRHGKA